MSTREEVEREAREEAGRAVGEKWNWDYRTETWRRGDTEAVENHCPDCGDDLGDHQYTTRDWHRCTCERAAFRTTFEAFLGEHAAEAVPTEWARAGFPARYASARFSTFEKRDGAETARARCQTWADRFTRGETDRGLLLVGPFGSGKTHLATAAAYRALERTLVRPRFVSAAALLQEVKGGDGLDMKPVRKAIGAELLVLDDVGQVGRTDFDRELMFSIVAERYDHRRPMIVSSNLPADRLGDLLGGALASRLHEACELLVLTASDYRKELGKKRGAA